MALSSRVSLLLVLAILCLDCCFTASLPQNLDRIGDIGGLRKKRPFCNAFTGCGKKRSLGLNVPDMRQRQFIDEDGFTSFSDNENIVDELSREILSEAKLLEAIQEANSELERRKQKEYAYNQ